MNSHGRIKSQSVLGTPRALWQTIIEQARWVNAERLTGKLLLVLWCSESGDRENSGAKAKQLRPIPQTQGPGGHAKRWSRD
jgi:hypothetical protein